MKIKSPSKSRKKTGKVVIASFNYTFDGEIRKSCNDQSEVTLTVVSKVWKFPTVADFKNEHNKYNSCP